MTRLSRSDRSSWHIAAPVALLALVLTGCSSLNSILGGEKTPPDEFRVVSRAPLSLPPDYGLTAPQPGAQRPQETDIRQTARQKTQCRHFAARAIRVWSASLTARVEALPISRSF